MSTRKPRGLALWSVRRDKKIHFRHYDPEGLYREMEFYIDKEVLVVVQQEKEQAEQRLHELTLLEQCLTKDSY